jgi:hypothetical protein
MRRSSTTRQPHDARRSAPRLAHTLAAAAVGVGLMASCTSGTTDAAAPTDVTASDQAQGGAPASGGATTTTTWSPPPRVEIGEFRAEHWMEDLAPQIGDRPLSELRIPGTHDAGSFSISRTDPVLSDAQNDAGTAQFEGIPTRRVADYVYTQNLTFTEQLDQGIRYLDFRLTCDADGMFIVHVFRGAPIGDALTEIAAWVDAHPREVLFLDVQKNYGCADRTYDVDGVEVNGNDLFTDLVRQAFGTELAPRPADADAATTLNGLVDDGTNVVAYFIQPSYAEANPDTYWLRTSGVLPDGAGMTNVWQPIPTMPEMFSYLVSQGGTFDDRGPSQMVLAALTTSPMFPKDSGIANCYRASLDGGCVTSLEQFLVDDVLPAMPVMVAAAADAGYNVISTDYPELGDWPSGKSFARLVVEQN